jgi:hypothetical protein
MSAQRQPGWDRRADNEVLYGGDVLLTVSENEDAAVILTSSIPSMPQRFTSLEVREDGAYLRRVDGQDIRFDTDPLLAEMAAEIGSVRVEEVELAHGGRRFERNEVYEIPVLAADRPVTGPSEVDPMAAPRFGM